MLSLGIAITWDEVAMLRRRDIKTVIRDPSLEDKVIVTERQPPRTPLCSVASSPRPNRIRSMKEITSRCLRLRHRQHSHWHPTRASSLRWKLSWGS